MPPPDPDKPPPSHLKWRGEPLDLDALRPLRPAAAATRASATVAAADLGAADLDSVCDALCLAGCERSKVWLTNFMRHLGWHSSSGLAFDVSAVGVALQLLMADGRVLLQPSGRHDVPEALRQAELPRLLARADQPPAWRASAMASAYAAFGSAPSAMLHGDPPMPDLRSAAEIRALARLALHGGLGLVAWQRVANRVLGPAADVAVLAEALTSPFAVAAFERMPADLRHALLDAFAQRFNLDTPAWAGLRAWLTQRLQTDPDSLPATLRLQLAEQHLHHGDFAAMQAVLLGLDGAGPAFVEAGALARQGRWVDGARAFALARKQSAKGTRARRGLCSERLLQLHLLCLMAQREAAAWSEARKLALAEAGSKTPPASGLGLWAHALAVRLGDTALQPGVLQAPASDRALALNEGDADALVLAAWLNEGQAARGWTPSQLGTLVALLHTHGAPWKADLVRQACERLGLRLAARTAAEGQPWSADFFGPRQEAWRDALAAIEALGSLRGDDAPAPAAVPTLQWRLRLDSAGRVAAVLPWEVPQGSRGPGKPRPLTLAKVKKAARLDPRDAAVARSIETQRWQPALLGVDVAAAAMALVGHPALFFDDQPEQAVELREGLPVLEVAREGGPDDAQAWYAFRLHDSLLSAVPPDIGEHFTASDVRAEAERRNSIRIVRDAPDRARLIRIGPAQRRVAELVAKQWRVPVAAQAELAAALKVLAGHFLLHSDAEAGQVVASVALLRAQLSPQGEGLRLRLLVRPFGDHGPVLVPGRGRARILALHNGLHLATERRLEAEAQHLAAVLEALPFLQDGGGDDSTWVLADPEQALAAVERLPQLASVAGVDWPRGKPVRVQSVAAAALQARVKSGADWFGLDGELQVAEGRVLGLQPLLRLVDAARGSRFIALGDGDYVALSDQLRRQLGDLQALAQTDARGGVRLPAAAAAWLSDAMDAGQLHGDHDWTESLQRLETAADLQPAVPPALQAELRSYQTEGFVWMARLAHAGFGACLADDMGLGKTVQTLALLLHRAADGPALVLAPTSVCSNWVAEAARFAPSLRLRLYGQAEAGATRAAALQDLGAGDVVVASYALAQIDDEAFARVRWGTLVADEAQVLKNVATKRSRSVAQIEAGFRLALSGTPVENRLADLWALMNLLNPGLLGSAAQFAERFAGPIERDRDPAVQTRLRRLVAPFLLRRHKSQVLADLPPRTEIVHRIEPGPEEVAFLEAMRRNALERVAAIGSSSGTSGTPAAFHVLTELTRLRRAACDPRLVAPELGLVGAKAQAFEQLAVELVAGRHKALVFSQFTDFLKLLAARLDAAGLRYQTLDGSTPAAERGRRVQAFQDGDGDLFLISLKAGGFGLNLTAADYVLIVDPWWNPAAEDQALGRAHRMGQQRPVTVYRLVTAGSVEERIIDLHRDKRALADGILEGQDGGAPLTAQAMRDLLLGP